MTPEIWALILQTEIVMVEKSRAMTRHMPHAPTSFPSSLEYGDDGCLHQGSKGKEKKKKNSVSSWSPSPPVAYFSSGAPSAYYCIFSFGYGSIFLNRMWLLQWSFFSCGPSCSELPSIRDKEEHKGSWGKEMHCAFSYSISFEGIPLPCHAKGNWDLLAWVERGMGALYI